MKSSERKSKDKVLRQNAEEILKKSPLRTGSLLSESDSLKILHELEVHRIELEMQSDQHDQLRQAWAMAETAADKYTELFDFAPIGYFTLSKDGNIIDLNLCGAQMIGRERLHVNKSLFAFFVSDTTKPIFNQFLSDIFDTKEKETCEVTLSNDDSIPFFVQLTGIVSKGGDQCLVTVVDITERKLAEAEINQKNEELSRVNAEKDKFFSIIAHDLRGPFQSLLGFSRMLAEDLSNLTMEQSKRMALNLKNSAIKLNNLLDNLLEWAIMQRGLRGFNPESFILLHGITPIIELFRETADKKMIRIRFDIPEDLSVFADAHMFKSLMSNLVSNAVKFTPHGGIISIMAKPISGCRIEVSIKDTGIGMTNVMVDNLFHLDKQSTRKGTEGEPSSGLGLLLCKDFIQRHDGQLWVESEEGKGSTFYFTLPT